MAKTSRTDPIPSSSDLHAMIAEAAYFKAEKRGFMPGLETTDWLDAEREVAAAVAKPASRSRQKTESKPRQSKKKKKKKA